MLQLVSVVLSPTDFQSILAELQSPAVLHSNPSFLESDLPVTPNPYLTPSPSQYFTEADSMVPPPYSSQLDDAGGDSPPKSPPRPSQLALSAPVFELPHPLPSLVRKPHIALNDQLLLSEEEDKSCPQQIHKPKTQVAPGLCEPDIDMAFSTSSPSLSSISSITPSTPERVYVGDSPLSSVHIFTQEDVCLKEGKKDMTDETKKVAEKAKAELEGNVVVERWIEQELIQNVEIKCEMVIQDKLKLANEIVLGLKEAYAQNKIDMEKEQHVIEGTVCRVDEVKNVLYPSEEQIVLIKTECEVEKSILAECEKEGIGGRVDIDVKACNEETLGQDKSECDSMNKHREMSLENIRESNKGKDFTKDMDCLTTHPAPHMNEMDCETIKEMKTQEAPAATEVLKDKGSEVEEDSEETNGATIKEILRQVEQAEKDLCSLSGWHSSDSSSVNVEPPTPGRSVSSDLLDKRETHEISSDSITSSSRGESARSRQNGNNTKHSPQDTSSQSSNVKKEEGALLSEKKVQPVTVDSGSEEEQTVTTKIFRRRIILKGEEARNVPGESMTEEHYMDIDGNLISRKVIRKVIRRVSTPTPDNQGSDSGVWRRRDPLHSPALSEEWSEVGNRLSSKATGLEIAEERTTEGQATKNTTHSKVVSQE